MRWADALVVSVVTRPRTLRKDVSELFYSRADEKRFRMEAEWEKPSIKFDATQISSPSDGADREPLWSIQSGKRKDYGISKAVVVFGNSTLTYGAEDGGGVAKDPSLEAKFIEPFSFDDAAFWNGRLTWS